MNTNELAFPCRVTRLRAPVSSEMCNFPPDPRKKKEKKKERSYGKCKSLEIPNLHRNDCLHK